MIKIKLIWLFAVAGFALLIFSTDSIDATTRDLALVLKVTGDAKVKAGYRNWSQLAKGQRLNSGDKIKTGDDALVALIFTDDKSMLKIRSDAEVSLGGERTSKGITKRLAMDVGQMWAKVNPKGAGFRLETPSGVAAVKGTEFYGVVDSFGNTTIIGIDGLVELLNEFGSVLVGKGQTGQITKGEKPDVGGSGQFDDWSDMDQKEGLIEIEFENADGMKKQLEIEYRQK
jgi:hypothetical protein